ncbi:MAG: Asp-tRNA(Asn)/Glu-tRNA(Gln) amidotransferase subunit GatB [Candidatus Omnitrophota bacterium]|jgi:aspartyl-tRNA(Asn)/glutamyl-tRNA(Gln) amidotransferase subunit B
MKYEAVIGLEVHVQLKTRTKIFCGCSTEFGRDPNSQVCPVCLGFPGVLPVLNKTVLEHAVKVSLALDCTVQEYTKFDRKNYFYPDLPKDFQISQYDLPVGRNGFLDITLEGGEKRVGILRVHLEEDAGKLIHKDDVSLVDFNRTGVPLLEIVSLPEMYSPEEAHAYLTVLKSVIEYLDVADCDMEKGSLRCDANVSIRPHGEKALGTKTEVKNMNSFKGVKDALAYEIERQIEAVENGEKIVQETRLWDAKNGKTFSMRSKEEAKDYRYFPEPDLPPFITTQEQIRKIKETIPELPREKAARFIREYGLCAYDAGILVFSKEDADYAEECIRQYPGENKKPVVNWLIGPLFSEANTRNRGLAALGIPPARLAELIDFVQSEQISNLTGKAVLTEMIDTQGTAPEIIKHKNLVQISDTGSLETHIEEILRVNAQSVESYKQGKSNALMFLVGQVMKKTQGKANPKVVQELLKKKLS